MSVVFNLLCLFLESSKWALIEGREKIERETKKFSSGGD